MIAHIRDTYDYSSGGFIQEEPAKMVAEFFGKHGIEAYIEIPPNSRVYRVYVMSDNLRYSAFFFPEGNKPEDWRKEYGRFGIKEQSYE